MKSESFDAYHEVYDEVVDDAIDFIGVEHDFYTQVKVDCLLHQLKRLYGDPGRLDVLDVGCGVGKTDSFLGGSFRSLSGVDVSAPCVERARRDNPQVKYSSYDGITLPYGDESFDAAFMVCVLHHVPAAKRLALMREVRRVVRPGGSVFVFEHNPFHPLTRIVVSRCVLDRGVSLLSRRNVVGCLRLNGLQHIDSQYIIYLPFDIPGVRLPACIKRILPFGTQFMVSGVKR